MCADFQPTRDLGSAGARAGELQDLIGVESRRYGGAPSYTGRQSGNPMQILRFAQNDMSS
jgi:hypothetical protein